MVACLLAASSGVGRLSAEVGWIGNSLGGQDGLSVAQDVADLLVLPDGTLLTNVPWDEAGGNVQRYDRDGRLLAVAGHTHGWGYEGGAAVAANARYVFLGQSVGNEGGGLRGSSWPPAGRRWFGVSRRRRSDLTQGAPFPGGRGKEGDVLPGAFLPVVELPEAGADAPGVEPRGLAADATRWFVSVPTLGAVRVYDAETMRPRRTIPLARPDRLALDGAGGLWAVQRPGRTGGRWRVIRFDAATGARTGPAFDLPPGVEVGDLAADGRGRLLVADAGPDVRVHVYGDLGRAPRRVSTFGTPGGVFAPPVVGRCGDRRFHRLSGVGADAAGNLYVASSGSVAGGSTVLESYRPDGALRWRRTGLLFVDLPAADPESPHEVFTKEERFVLDPSRTTGEVGRYAGVTVHPFRYPDDPRLRTSPATTFVRRLGGRRFLFVTDMTGTSLSVHRFDPAAGEIAIPCGLLAPERLRFDREPAYPPGQPRSGEWIWSDGDGDGRIEGGEYVRGTAPGFGGRMWPDEAGTIWQASERGLRATPLAGIGARGAPEWLFSRATVFPRPAEFDEVRHLRYLPASGRMVLGGGRGEDRHQHWKPMGPVLAVYDDWRGARRFRASVVLPYAKGSSGHESAEPISFDVAGDHVFVAYTRGLPEFGTRQAFVLVLRLDDLSRVGVLSAEAEVGETGLLDLVDSVSAVREPDGAYRVFLEDDLRAKTVVFRWRP